MLDLPEVAGFDTTQTEELLARPSVTRVFFFGLTYRILSVAFANRLDSHKVGGTNVSKTKCMNAAIRGTEVLKIYGGAPTSQ